MEDIELDEVVVFTCVMCTDEVDEGDVMTDSDTADTMCVDCARVCEHCDYVGNDSDEWCSVDNELWCRRCTDYNAYWCDRHDEYSTDGTSHISDRGESWCADCTDNYATWCDTCDEYNANGCNRNCDEDTYDGERVVHDYSYRPDPIFHSTDDNSRLFFGMEIEMEADGSESRSEASRHAYKRLERDTNLAYLKNDGSLDCGFEVVTHPMTYDFFMNEAPEFWETINQLKHEYKMKSWSTGSCGIHIHISRTGFTNPPHLHRFLQLVYSNQVFYEEMAGRSHSHWAKFDDVMVYDNGGYHRSYKRKVASPPNHQSTDRYSAVNTNNRATVEMRIFRGSLNVINIRGALGLAHASVEYTRNMSVQDVRNGSLNADKLIEYIESQPELYADTITRMNKAVTKVTN